MSPPDEQGRLTVDQAVGRFRARVIAELRTLNGHLPGSRRLERAEIDRLVDNLLFAHRETPKRRNASLLDKAVWIASEVFVQAIRRRGGRRKATGSITHRNRQAAHGGEQLQGDTRAPTLPLARAHLENADAAEKGARNGSCGARDHL